MLKDEASIYREYKFANFIEAFSFMASIAIIAEEIQHHPDWYNVYNTVRVNLNTHDVKGISEKDLILAYLMVNLFFFRLKEILFGYLSS